MHLFDRSMMFPTQDPYNEFNGLPIAKSIETRLRRRIVLLQVISDQIRNYNVLLITDNNEVYAFGDNTNGCLGLGHCDPVLECPVMVKELQGKDIVQIATGHLFVVAITRFGDPWSWGLNTSGQLAQLMDPVSCPRIMKPTEMPVWIPKSTHIVQVACGYAFAVALTIYGDVFTFGDNSFGQLGLGGPADNTDINQIYEIDKISEISCGANHLVLLSVNRKTVYVCGDNQFGQLGLSQEQIKVNRATSIALCFKPGESIKSIGCGAAHTLLLLTTGMIYAFGDNRHGQLGTALTGSTTCTSVPQLILVDQLFDKLFTINLSNISLARSSSRKARLYVWGSIKKKDIYRQEVDLSKQRRVMMATNRVSETTAKDTGPRDGHLIQVFAQPRRSYLGSVAKLFALYEPSALTFCEKLTFDSAHRKGRPKDICKWFMKKEMADVHFVLDRECLLAHKVVLATYSDYFAHLFDFESEGSCHSGLNRIHICDFSYQAYRAYLHFIYTGSLLEGCNGRQQSVSEQIKLLVQLIELALVYEESDLYEVCLHHLTLPHNQLMQPGSVMLIYNEAYQCQAVPVMEKCIDFIAANWTEMLKQPDFERWRSSKPGLANNALESRIDAISNYSMPNGNASQVSPSRPESNNRSVGKWSTASRSHVSK